MGVSFVSLPERPGAFKPSACRSSALFTCLVYLNVSSLQVGMSRRICHLVGDMLGNSTMSANHERMQI